MRTRINLATLTEYADVMGEEMLNDVLQSFSCPLNAEVESYIKEKAILSMRKSSTVTYLAFDGASGEVVGYFTLMMKAYSVESKMLSSKNRRLVERFSQVGDQGKFVVPVYLIAQIGKNFALPKDKQVVGVDLLKLALDRFSIARHEVGGKLVMIEREANRPKLLEFYNNNGFKSWTRRVNDKDGIEYDQMFAVLNDEPSTTEPAA